MVQMEIKSIQDFFFSFKHSALIVLTSQCHFSFVKMHFLEIVLWEFGPQSEVFYIFVIFVVDSIFML